eukprot:6135774-Amphidinium_carterae.2
MARESLVKGNGSCPGSYPIAELANNHSPATHPATQKTRQNTKQAMSKQPQTSSMHITSTTTTASTAYGAAAA